MAVYGSNTFQWEPIVRVLRDGDKVTHIPTVRFRHKDTIIGVLGVSLGSWSPWYWENPDETKYLLTDFTPCDEQGNPL